MKPPRYDLLDAEWPEEPPPKAPPIARAVSSFVAVAVAIWLVGGFVIWWMLR